MNLHPALRVLLWAPSIVFGLLVRLRAWLYRTGLRRQHRLNGVVISVGNLTVGGTGKTPLVGWLAGRLFGEGKRVGILSRGYRGAGETSDEVGLLRHRLDERVQISVGADRLAQGRALERKGTEWFVLDDGFQHLRLARDADIVLIDATDPFGGGHLLPAGRLREPKSALRRADLVVITRSDHAPAIETIVRRHTAAPIFYAQTFLEEVRPGKNSRVAADASAWLGKKAFAFCAIGNRAAFFEDVRRWGMQLAGQMGFRDHHRYTARDVERIERRALAAGAEILVATEKDEYNLGRFTFERLPLYHCVVTVRVSDAETFWRALHATIERKRARAPR